MRFFIAPRRHRSALLPLSMLTVLLALFTGTGGFVSPGGAAPGSHRLNVVTTIFPYADMVRAVGGEHVDVIHLLPPGASPHTFEPRPSQVRDAARADLIIWNGTSLDDWIERLIDRDTPALRLKMTDGLPLLAWEEDELEDHHHHGSHDHHHGSHDHRHGSHDPHIWLDPVIVRDHVAPRIAAALSRLMPERQAVFQENLAAYQADLTELDAYIRDSLADLRQRQFVTHHSAWRYFAARYGLEEIGTLALFPGQEPSAQWLAHLVRLMERVGVRTLFAEPQLNPQAARVIADEIGGRLILLDPLGDPSLPGRNHYIDLMRFNAQALLEGLQPDGEHRSP